MLRFCLEGFLTKANLVMHAHAQFFLSLVKRFVSITSLDRYYPSISGALQFLLKPPLESEQSRIIRSVPFSWIALVLSSAGMSVGVYAVSKYLPSVIWPEPKSRRLFSMRSIPAPNMSQESWRTYCALLPVTTTYVNKHITRQDDARTTNLTQTQQLLRGRSVDCWNLGQAFHGIRADREARHEQYRQNPPAPQSREQACQCSIVTFSIRSCLWTMTISIAWRRFIPWMSPSGHCATCWWSLLASPKWSGYHDTMALHETTPLEFPLWLP